jgi:hypothetical protein
MTAHKVVTREEWDTTRGELLKREKEHTRMADDLARAALGRSTSSTPTAPGGPWPSSSTAAYSS